jgi:O-antigen ligase
MKREEFHKQVYFILSVLIAFFIPVYIYVIPVFIIVIFLNWIAEGNFSNILSFLKSKYLLLFISYYLLYLIGMLWTNNQNSGWFDLEVKLPILVFPLIAFRLRDILDSGKISQVLFAFVAGCIVGSIICISHASYMWFYNSENCFYYAKLSVFLHPAYFSMYILLAITMLLRYFLRNTIQFRRKVMISILIGWFWVFIILLQSKAGILIASFVFLINAVLVIISTKKYLQIAISLLVIFCGYYLVNRFIITANNSRIYNAEYNILDKKIDTTTTESSQIRLLVWKASEEIIKSNYLYGVGTGDIKDELNKMYQKMNMQGALKEHLNAHNQYIQSAIGLGITGIIIILLMFLLPLILSIKEKNYLYAFFLMIVSLNILVESMFETQAGVMFYAFFNILFFIKGNE